MRTLKDGTTFIGQNSMIDPIHSLAFSIQSNPGVYALLLGSGVSRAAKIPTGWEITLDLIRKLALLLNEQCDPDPEAWYLKKFNKEASYSDLLHKVAKTQSERQQLLREYFEPNEADRESGDKSPTKAHKAIAQLVAKGFIRVIITTNFDRLIETAIREAGVEPQVLSTPDQIEGALPLIHTKCCVFKINGDYKDTRIKNTPDELDQIPRGFDRLLDRIFDEFGLIVCGWSAEWDGALYRAIERAKSRRYSIYWTVKGELGDAANKLIEHRGGYKIPIRDAENFFETILEYVISIDEYSKRHPISTEAAVQSLKRYLPEPKYRIKLRDLVNKEVQDVKEKISISAFPMNKTIEWTNESVTKRVRSYEAACSTLLSMGIIGGSWVEEKHDFMWKKTLENLAPAQVSDGDLYVWLDLKRYPATLLFYALGVGAVEGGHLHFLNYLFNITLYNFRGSTATEPKSVKAVKILPPYSRFDHLGSEIYKLEIAETSRLPLNDWIRRDLRTHANRIFPDEYQYFLAFEKFEILIALHSLTGQESIMTPGLFCISRRHDSDRFIHEIKESLLRRGNLSSFVNCRIFGETVEQCLDRLDTLESQAEKFFRDTYYY